jgi:hypothetical protein
MPRSISKTIRRLGAAGAGRDGYRGRVHLDVEDLFDAGLAHRASPVGNERIIAALAG